MQIFFHWNVTNFYNCQQPTYEEKFTDDLQTLFNINPKEAHVYFNLYIPPTLSGIITDEAGKKLCSHNCDLAGNTTTYDLE